MKRMDKKKILEDQMGKFYDFISSLSQQKNTGIYFALIYILFMLPIGLVFHDIGSYHITSEDDFFSSYIPHSEQLLNGNFIIDVYRGPLYVFLLSFIKILTGNYLAAGIIISTLSAGVFLFLTHLILKNLFSPLLAFVVLILTALNPFFIEYSYGAGTDMFFNSLAAASIYFFLISKNYSRLTIILSAAFAALAFLTRYNALFLLLSIPCLILFSRAVSKYFKKRIISASIFACVVVLITLPWGLYTLSEKGEFFYNENYRNIAISLGTDGKIDWDKAWNNRADEFDSLSEIVTEEPVLLFKTLTANLFHHSYKNMIALSTLHIGVFVLIGIFFFKRKRMTIQQSAYYIINFSFFILLVPLFYDSRFFLFLIPFFCVPAYFGIKAVSGLLKVTMGLILTGLICFSAVSSIGFNNYTIKAPDEIKLTADVFNSLKIGKKEKEIIASRRPLISYPLNMKWIKLPFGKSIIESIKELKKENADYIFFSKAEFNERKKLRPLINPKNAPPGLTPVIYLPDEPAVLYRIED